MLSNLYFVRHAHSLYTPDEMGRPLSKQGLEDAEKVTQFLKEEKIDLVLSSPYQRAHQTVWGIAETLGKEVIIENGFKERLLSITPVYDFEIAIQKVWEDPTFSWEGGESNATAQKRGIQATLKVLETYQGKNIVIGTHGNLLVLIMNYFNQSYGYNFWMELDMPDIYKLTFDNNELKKIKRIWSRTKR
ncbi:phosphoglycerate mutase [Bacillus sp. FJAT-27225]|uniref:histidine phosphatase family protein n=1 Tax=Bacillus sp. FJAT-27225 TaxID=1743144 RepID=UPI00080C2B40|nr:histidine phosphatase family protein [Bacillus sp. FJAT-27225]OCA81652.1 phosphoglycerate mutase [Bacillus sp. FJAT-27225]